MYRQTHPSLSHTAGIKRQERHEVLIVKGVVDDVDYLPFPSWEAKEELVSFVNKALSLRYSGAYFLAHCRVKIEATLELSRY